MHFSGVGLHNLQNLTTAPTCKPVNIKRGQGVEFKTITIETAPDAIYILCHIQLCFCVLKFALLAINIYYI